MTLKKCCLRTLSSLFLSTVIVVCITLWVFHSLYFLWQYETANRDKTIISRKISNEVKLPSLVICNRMPFSQTKLRQIPLLNQDYILKYLREWVESSLRLEPSYTPLGTQEQLQAQQLLAQLLPYSIRKKVLSDTFLQCLAVINSCSFQGRTFTAEQCCNNIQRDVVTTRGICWLFTDDTSQITSIGMNNDLQFTFRIPRDFYSTPLILTYPGIDAYLVDDVNNQSVIEINLEDRLRLRDKRGIHFRIHKEVDIDLRRRDCGVTAPGALSVDRLALQNNRTNLFECVLMSVIKYCNCHPLLSEFLHADISSMSALWSRINESDVCTLDSYNNCARAFLAYASQNVNDEPLPSNDNRISNAVAVCRSQNHLRCTKIRYKGHAEEYSLADEFRNNQDFIARLTVSFETVVTTEAVTVSDRNFYEYLNFIGFALALWFAVGHITWSVFKLVGFCCLGCDSKRKQFMETSKRNSIVPIDVQPKMNGANGNGVKNRFSVQDEPLEIESISSRSNGLRRITPMSSRGRPCSN